MLGTDDVAGSKCGCPWSACISNGRWPSTCYFDSEAGDAAEVAPNARWLVAPTGCNLPAERWDGGTGGYLAWVGRYDIRTKGLDLLVQAMTRLPTPDRRPLRLHGKRSEDSAGDIASIARHRASAMR